VRWHTKLPGTRSFDSARAILSGGDNRHLSLLTGGRIGGTVQKMSYSADQRSRCAVLPTWQGYKNVFRETTNNAMTNRIREFSIQTYARIAGVLYLINIAAGLLGEIFVRNAMIVSGDAAATAANITHSPLLWRVGIAGDLIMQATDVPLMMIF
jgi:hypothetical protein